jgi:hypothetical protein
VSDLGFLSLLGVQAGAYRTQRSRPLLKSSVYSVDPGCLLTKVSLPWTIGCLRRFRFDSVRPASISAVSSCSRQTRVRNTLRDGDSPPSLPSDPDRPLPGLALLSHSPGHPQRLGSGFASVVRSTSTLVGLAPPLHYILRLGLLSLGPHPTPLSISSLWTTLLLSDSDGLLLRTRCELHHHIGPLNIWPCSSAAHRLANPPLPPPQQPPATLFYGSPCLSRRLYDQTSLFPRQPFPTDSNISPGSQSGRTAQCSAGS